MKINLLTVFVFFMVSFSLKAQESPVIVLSVIGQIEYQKDQSSSPQRLIPGMEIIQTGTLNLKQGAKVNLLYNSKQIPIDEEGVYNLQTLTKNNGNALNMSFTARFWDFVSSGLSQSDDKKSLNEYSDQVLAVTGGVKGFALDESALQTIMPAEGNIGADLVTFNWNRSKGTANYHFIIYLSDNKEVVFKAIVRDTSFTLDFSQLVFYPETSYKWRIEIEQQNDSGKKKARKKSDSKAFEYFSNADELIIQKADKLEDYKKADNFDKKWMEAIVMEQEYFIYDAYARYSNLRLQNPDNLLVKKLFAAFLVRQGLTQEALKQMD